MNGIHDLGGMHGFGGIEAPVSDDEANFHAEWERDVAATVMALAAQRYYSVDRFRYTIERSPPVEYLRRSYYEKWLCAIEQLVVEAGLVSSAELASGHTLAPTDLAALPRWEPVLALDDAPLFAAGDRVRVSNRHPEQHTRSPRYARGRLGLVESRAAAEPLPEQAAGDACAVQHVYRVRFEGTELWGPQGGGRDAVYLELWEGYLEPAP